MAAEAAAAEAETYGRPGEVFKRLRILNGVMCCFHLAQGVLMIVLSSDYRVPLTTSFLSSDPVTRVTETVTREVASIRLGPLVGIFLLISALAHFLLTMPGIFEWYVKNLKRHINYARWVEYFFSSSLMIVIIAILSGMYDVPSLVLLFFLNGMMILFGLIMEVHNQTTEKTNWLSFYCGCLAGLVPWVVVALYFFSAAAQSSGNMPTFVYFIMASLFIFFNLFAVNMALQYKKVGPWRDYIFGEKAYILLSLVAKSALAWQVFGGTRVPR